MRRARIKKVRRSNKDQQITTRGRLRRTISMGNMDWIAETADAINLDAAGMREHNLVNRVAALVDDQRVPAGCIKGGKLRPDRLWARFWLLREIGDLRPREIAKVYKVSPRYVSNAILKGEDIIRNMGAMGLLESFKLDDPDE